MSMVCVSLGLPDAVAFYPLTVSYRGYDVGPKKNPPGKLFNVRPAPGPDGRRGGSYSFLRSPDSFIEFANTGPLDTRNSITLLVWVNPKGGAGPIFNYDPRGFGVHLWVTRAGRLFARFVRRTRALTRPLISRRLRRKSWSFVGATYDQTTGIGKLYVNDKEVVSKAIGRIRLATNYPVRMGARIRDRRYFRGWITCMQVYDVALPLRLIKIAKKLCFKGSWLSNPSICCFTSCETFITHTLYKQDNVFVSSRNVALFHPNCCILIFISFPHPCATNSRTIPATREK